MIINSIIESFILTMLIEYTIIKIIFRKMDIFVPVLLVNLLTNPLVVFIYNVMNLFLFSYKDIVLIFLELLVFIVEGYVYKHLLDINWKKSMIVSFVANMVAYLTGVLLTIK